MKFALASLLCFARAGCHGSNRYGECIGLGDEADPNLVYKIDVWNTVWSFLGVETLIAPVLWATSYAKCPVGVKGS